MAKYKEIIPVIEVEAGPWDPEVKDAVDVEVGWEGEADELGPKGIVYAKAGQLPIRKGEYLVIYPDLQKLVFTEERFRALYTPADGPTVATDDPALGARALPPGDSPFAIPSSEEPVPPVAPADTITPVGGGVFALPAAEPESDPEPSPVDEEFDAPTADDETPEPQPEVERAVDPADPSLPDPDDDHLTPEHPEGDEHPNA